MIVQKDDASYPGIGEVLPIRANHVDICKFDDADDEGYKQVKSKIKQFAEIISESGEVKNVSFFVNLSLWETEIELTCV